MSDTTKGGMLALTGTFIGLTTTALALRFYARHKAKLRYLADDWLMLMAWISFIGGAVCIFLLVDIEAIGYSSFEFTKQEVVDRYKESTQLQVAYSATQMMGLACTKASALFFYRRIFCTMTPNARVFNAISIALVVVMACWLVTFELLNGLQCHGHFDTWDTASYAKYCTISWNFLFGYTVSDFLLDVLVIALPIPMVMRLHTTLARKLSILSIFMLACIALGASCARMVIFIRIFDLGLYNYNHLDSEHILTRLIFYATLETGISIVAISLPSLWPLFRGGSLESIMKLARSVTSLASRSSNHSAKESNGASRSDSIQLDELTKIRAEETSVPDVPKQAKLEILRQDMVQVSSKRGSLEDGFGPENSWR